MPGGKGASHQIWAEPIAKDRGDLPGGGIAHADLHDLRRMPSHQGPGENVVVLRHDEEPLVTGERPDLLIVVRGEPVVAKMTASGEARLEQVNQTMGKDSGRRGPSRHRPQQAAFTLGSERQTGADVVG